MEKQLPFEHLVIVLLEGAPPGMSSSELLRREPFIQLNCMALLEKVDDHLTIADARAIQLYPRVLALRPFARVRFINLLIGKARQLEPCQELQSERADRGQAPVCREGEDLQGGHQTPTPNWLAKRITPPTATATRTGAALIRPPAAATRGGALAWVMRSAISAECVLLHLAGSG